ncbi:MGT4A acetylglucosaminyltransferase, partial [Pandion haliaetus]|nr:MGT4A acetylglucosaminyltransferase [Pandion haliaetus]
RWRTKQNLDYCFLMMYAQRKGVYYIQLEDDIVVKQNYFSTIKNFALQLASEDWMILEFSQLGFIGKMFQSPDITLIVEFIFMFYKEKPIDWLLDHILWVKVCNPEKDAKHCDRQKSNLRIRFRPSLFQHVGLHSSLAGKIQKLTDKDFLKPLLHKIHVNPPAEVSTSLKVYQGHTLEKTYVGEDFFWAVTPVAGDYILFKFDKPVNVER